MQLNKVKKVLASVVSLALVVSMSVVAPMTVPAASTNTVALISLAINPNTVTLGTIGGSFVAKPTYNPSNTTQKGVFFSSSNTKVVTVNNTGVVKAIGYGTATVKAQSTANGKLSGFVTVTVSKTVTIHMLASLNPEIVLKNNPLISLIKQDLNINLVVEAPPQSSYGDRASVEVAAGDMPDLMINGTDVNETTWAKQGVFANLTSLVKNYPNLMTNISPQQWGDVKLTGDNTLWGVPRPNSYDKWGFIINKAWLDKLRLSVPTTVAQFNAVCAAFTKDDPDGDGKADTYGCAFGAQQSSLDSGVWHMYNDFLSTAYNISNWNVQMPDANGSFTLRPYKSEYYDYLGELRSLYSQNIIDRDFITFNSNENLDAFAQGKVGITGASETGFMTNIVEFYNLNPKNYIFCAPLTLKAGQTPNYVLAPSNWMAFYINAKSKVINDCLRLLDWGNSAEGFTAMQFGIQGQDYTSYSLDTRQITQTTAQHAKMITVAGGNFSFANAFQQRRPLEGGNTAADTAIWKTQSAATEAVTANMYVPFVKYIDGMSGAIPDQAKALSTLEVQYVTGQATLAQLKAYVNGAYKKASAPYEAWLQNYMKSNPINVVKPSK
jgi:putative aldouronate transport system substrate-binding protein